MVHWKMLAEEVVHLIDVVEKPYLTQDDPFHRWHPERKRAHYEKTREKSRELAAAVLEAIERRERA